MGSTLDSLRARAEGGDAEAQRQLAYALGSDGWSDDERNHY